ISPCLRGSKCSARPVQALGFGFFRSSACLGGSPVISNLRSRAKPVPRATVFSAPSTDSPPRTPRTVGWHSSSVRESVASQIRTSASSPQTRAPPVKRHLVCKRWTIEKADENSNGIPWFVLHRPNSDKLRFHLPSLPWHWLDA